MVYDVTDKDSFKAVDNWMSEVDKFASESAIKIFVGNKCDSDDKRRVTFEEGKDLAAHYNVKFIETSAKNSKNVVEAFQTLTKEIKARVLPKKSTTTPHTRIPSPLDTVVPASGPKKLSSAKGKQISKQGGCCK